MKNVIKTKTKIKTSFKINQKHIDFLNILKLPNEKLNDKIEKEIAENEFLEYNDPPKNNNNKNIIKIQYDDAIINNSMLYTETLYSYLMSKMECLFFNEKDKIIAEYIISSLNDKGYFTTSYAIVINDIKVMNNINCNNAEIDAVLHKLQTLEPAGICARSLQECLLIQLLRQKTDKDNIITVNIIQNYWEEFSKRHFDKIKKKLMLSDDVLERVIVKIKNLNPIPGNIFNNNSTVKLLKPDFKIEEHNGKIYVTLNNQYIHNVKIKQLSKLERLKSKNNKYNDYMRYNYENAKNFLQMLEKREHSLLNIMEIIVQIQHDYFTSGDIKDLKPMKLKDISEKANLDVSIISRIVNSKVVETSFGTFLLKNFFSKGIKNKNGTIVSNKVIKNEIENIISNNKNHINDKAITLILNEKGFNIARRTVTKYRQQLLLPSTRVKYNI